MRVAAPAARRFYETEAVQANWSRRDLERQISSLFYERLLASPDQAALLESARQSAPLITALDMLKDPYVLIDLKIGPLTHQDIGQMDGYVRLYEAHDKVEGDNPTIGLILCSEKNSAVARYSVLHESAQLFAAKYQFTLPSEEDLQREILRERALIENQMDLS